MSEIIKQKVPYQKKYKCPYCELRSERNKLENHIEKKHKDVIPKGYTPARIVFNTINKKDHGTCIICQKESPWNEDKKRYERLCGDKSCHDKYVKMTEDRLKKKTGKTKKELLSDDEFQRKMLSNRSISGTYKFSDGGTKSYVGSYEKSFLEFMDKFFRVKSEDIVTPGPTIEYEYNGKKHKWITDAYYIPYNLVFDIKDGGDNPNNRPMKEYREKQDAKEKAISKLGVFNYIRLTDNNFEQLILLMLELKDSLINFDNNKNDIVIRINEDAGSLIGASIPPTGYNDVYVTNYYKNNVFSGESNFALHLKDMDKIFIFDEDKFKAIDRDQFIKENTIINTFRCIKEGININHILENAKSDRDIYNIITDKVLLDDNQLLFDNNFERVIPFTDELESIYESIISTAKNIDNKYKSPLFWLNESNIEYWRDLDGIYITNGILRSKSYNNKDDIPESTIYILS